MSGIDSLPGGGDKFSAGRFKSKLKYLSKNSSALSPLSENQEAIAKAVSKYQGSIKRGSFDKSQQRRAISQIKKGGDLNASQLRTVGKIMNKLAENNVKAPVNTKTRLNAEGKVAEVGGPKAKINRAGREEELSGPKLAGANRDRGSGLSDAFHEEYASASNERPLVSINQKKEFARGTGLAEPGRSISSSGPSSSPASSSRPSIPLSR
jgi:hypothetical protein